MSQLLNKLTNLVVSKITDEELIQTKSYGQPAIVVVDEEKGLRYGPEDYDHVEMELRQGVEEHFQYYYYPHLDSINDPETKMAYQTSILPNGLYFYNIGNITIYLDNNHDYFIYADMNEYESYEDSLVMLEYQGEDEIVINMKIYQEEENNGESSGGDQTK